ncbi:MAG: FkbM family methyltransferase [Patescibacteria group bacterium]
MKFKKENIVKKKALKFLRAIADHIESNNKDDFGINGEERFLNDLANYYKKHNNLCVFDIGANVGNYSKMVINKLNSRNIKYGLHLFEPTAGCFSELKNNFENNRNIVLNNFALSDSEGNSSIFYDKEKSGLASLYKRELTKNNILNIEFNKSEKIELKRLDNYIEENNIEHIDFIKIDVEGHEINVFKGMGKILNSDFVDFMQFEYGGCNLDSMTNLMKIYELLRERKFIIFKVLPKYLELRDYDTYMDNFSNANYVAISNKVFKKIKGN